MDREWGAKDALAFVRRTDFAVVELRLRRGNAARRRFVTAARSGLARKAPRSGLQTPGDEIRLMGTSLRRRESGAQG